VSSALRASIVVSERSSSTPALAQRVEEGGAGGEVDVLDARCETGDEEGPVDGDADVVEEPYALETQQRRTGGNVEPFASSSEATPWSGRVPASRPSMCLRWPWR